MLNPGIYSMQDFHLFRLVEFDRCIRDFQIPCRWSPDAGFSYGEPMFNFYGQGAYWLGAALHTLTISFINSLKLTFIVSLAGSFFAMFFLAKKIWRDKFAALLSASVYLYAPYRAVDVWVRGALPEAFSFIIFPLIILSSINYFESRKRIQLIFFSFLLFFLIITHNLSFLMFLPFLVVFTIYKLWSVEKKAKVILELGGAALASILLSSFYILPVIIESQYVNLAKATTSGYFDWRAHFATINELLFSRFWGYGASVFGPDDGLSLSIGQFQWILPIVALIIAIIKKDRKQLKFIVLLFGLGWFYLFLTHNKSTYIWINLPFMPYIQFPWRFIGMAVFSFSLAAGYIMLQINKVKRIYFLAFIVIALIAWNFSFFREDIWYDYKDDNLLTGVNWDIQRQASVGDFWPNFGEQPTSIAPKEFDNEKLLSKNSNSYSYEVSIEQGSKLSFPIAYFPGWTGKVDNEAADVYPDDKNGLVTAFIPEGKHTVNLSFQNTPARNIGNLMSAATLFVLVLYLAKIRKK